MRMVEVEVGKWKWKEVEVKKGSGNGRQKELRRARERKKGEVVMEPRGSSKSARRLGMPGMGPGMYVGLCM